MDKTRQKKAAVTIGSLVVLFSSLIAVVGANQIVNNINYQQFVTDITLPAIIIQTETDKNDPTPPISDTSKSQISLIQKGNEIIVSVQNLAATPSAIEIYLMYDPNLLQVENLQPNLANMETVLERIADNETGNISYTSADLDQSIPPGIKTLELFSFTYSKPQDEPATISLVDTPSQSRYIDINLNQHIFSDIHSPEL